MVIKDSTVYDGEDIVHKAKTPREANQWATSEAKKGAPPAAVVATPEVSASGVAALSPSAEALSIIEEGDPTSPRSRTQKPRTRRSE